MRAWLEEPAEVGEVLVVVPSSSVVAVEAPETAAAMVAWSFRIRSALQLCPWDVAAAVAVVAMGHEAEDHRVECEALEHAWGPARHVAAWKVVQQLPLDPLAVAAAAVAAAAVPWQCLEAAWQPVLNSGRSRRV